MIRYFHDKATLVMSPDSHGGGGAKNNPGNFKNDPEKASEAGHKGGQESSGNFKKDPEKASEAGHKGGQASHKK